MAVFTHTPTVIPDEGNAKVGATLWNQAHVVDWSGQLVLPTQGVGGGILIGGDTQLYREFANVLAIAASLHVIRTWAPGVEDNLAHFEATANIDNPSGNAAALRMTNHVRPTINNTSGTGNDGLYAIVNHDAGAFSLTWIRGIHALVIQSVAGSVIGEAVGTSSSLFADAGTITQGRGLLAEVVTNGGTITTGIGVDIANRYMNGTYTTSIGLRIQAFTGTVGTNIAIQSLGGENRFVGQTKFGTAGGGMANTLSGDVTVGRLFVGDNAAPGTGTRFQVYYDTGAYAGGALNVSRFFTVVHPQDGTGGSRTIDISHQVQPTATNTPSGDHRGINVILTHDSGAFAITLLAGGLFSSTQNVAASTVDNNYGVYAQAVAQAGTVTAAHTGWFATIANGGTITTGVGVDIQNQQAAGGVFTTSIGLRINAFVGVAGTNIAIQSLSGYHQFVGSAIFGSSGNPANVTPGDVSVLRLHVGADGVMTAQKGLETYGVNVYVGGPVTTVTGLAGVVAIAPVVTTAVAYPTGLSVTPIFDGAGDYAVGMYFRPIFRPSVSSNAVYGALWQTYVGPAGGIVIASYVNAQIYSIFENSAGQVNAATTMLLGWGSNGLKPISHTGLQIVNHGSAGITTAIALQIDAQIGASGANIGLLSLSADNRIQGNLRVGYNSAAAVPLDVNGNAIVSGTLLVGTTGVASYQMQVAGTTALGIGIGVNPTMTATSAQGLAVFPTFAPAAGPASAIGFNMACYVAPAAGVTISNVYGGYAQVVFNGTTGAVTTSMALVVQSTMYAGGYIKPGSSYGLVVYDCGFTGVATTVGVYIAAQTGTLAYALQILGGNVQLGGDGGILTTATSGHVRLPWTNGVPTGAPVMGEGSMVWDVPHAALYVWASGAWRHFSSVAG